VSDTTMLRSVQNAGKRKYNMENNLMNLKILLPFKVFADVKNVNSVVVETSEGSFGLLPQRLDCVAALVPGIFTYETGGISHYVAVDNGIMVKAGTQLLVSVRNAVDGADLGKLGELVKKEFKSDDENQKQVTTVIAKLERGFIYSFDKLRNT
jgi:F-type H+-transporting ATPase subunit epsilon